MPKINLPPLEPGRLPPGFWLNLPSLPDEFYKPIGLVVAFWGSLEKDIDDFHLRILQNGLHDRRDRRSLLSGGFEQKFKALRKKVLQHFPVDASSELKSILDEIDKIKTQRDIIVHGHFQIRTISNDKFLIFAMGYRRHEAVEIEITADGLSQLYHELAILRGKLHGVCDPQMVPSNLSVATRLWVQNFLGGPMIETIPL
jgi:hypothetical protein